MKTRQIQLWCLVVFPLAVVLIWQMSARPSSANATSASKDPAFNKLIDVQAMATREGKTYRLPAIGAGRVCSLLVSTPSPAAFGEKDALDVSLRVGKKTVASKSLHAGDPDFYTLFRSGETAEVEINSLASGPIEHTLTVLEWSTTANSNTSVELEPNDSWREANEFKLGQTVWATADDKPYIQPLGDGGPARGAAPYAQQPDSTPNPSSERGLEMTLDRLPEGGVDWFKFRYEDAEPKLVHFELDLLERDNIPVDVSVFTVENDEVKSYDRGADPVTPPHEVQALPGNKFTTRILTRGTYYIRVDANHVFYRLRTSVYDRPPFGVQSPGGDETTRNAAQKAVRAGMDYLVSAGDSWHANMPRHGGIVSRVSSNHFETQLCIACHATHFTTRGELTAKRNGYAVNKRSSLQFLTERLANNPLPFYGHKDAYWTRVISASANVMSRLATLVNQYDNEFTGEKRLSLLKGVAGYLKIYYKGRTELPNDESNGNTPLVSAYEVAWYSWKVFDELFKLTADAEAREYRDQIRRLIEQEKIKNNVDLCYQTLAFADIDRNAYAGQIKRNAERILSLQRADGQWSMLFEKDSPSVEFQTYHCLYTLARAGYSPEQPQIALSLKFLLDRQQEWGGWFDPKQSYENFRTPFRETQFAVMALSEFYKGSDGKGWLTPPVQSLSTGDVALRLERIDNVWTRPSPQLVRELTANLGSEEPMLRMAAAAALGRINARGSAPQLQRLLGDRSKLVQIAAAQAIRRIASEFVIPPSGGSAQSREIPPKGGTTNLIIAALKSRNERTRWGATRVFAQHFSYLTGKNEIAENLIARLSDPYVMVRMQAAKSLTQWFYWTKDDSIQDRIADAFIARMGSDQHPWMRRNLMEGFYSQADENVRYLYNNWIGNLAQKEDRDKSIAAHHEASRRMAERIARALETGNELQREGLLRGLTEFHLRHGGYTNAGRYTRIGNDIETVVFYSEGAPALEKALGPLVNAPDATRRQQAVLAAFTLRDNSLTSLPLAVMRRLNDPDASVRAVSNEFYRSLPLKVVEQNRREAAQALKELLASKYPEAQIAALDRIKSLGSEFALSEKFDEAVRDFALRTDSGPDKVDKKTAAAALRALADFPTLASDQKIQERIASALQSSDLELSRAATQLTLLSPPLRGQPAIAAALDSLLNNPSVAKRKMLLDLVTAETPVNDDLRLISLLAESLEARDESVRSAALNAVRRVKALQSNAAIRAGLSKLTKDPNQRLQGLAIAMYQGQDGGVALDLRAEEMLDYGFFAQRVAPLLARKGPDNNACVNCHTTHTIFKLMEPDKQGRFSDEQLRENYRSALKVVDLANPENSLLIRKPTGDASQEGLVGSKKTPHGGGMRWNGLSDPAVQTVLEWINGAKLIQK